MDERTTLRAFDGLAATYARSRPSYPPAIIEAALAGLTQPPRVADIGCGTGISSRLLRAAGALVTGIDPGEDMLREARAMDEPGIEFRRGTAEETGLPGQSVDLVFVAQAFHWFDPARALAEFTRILVAEGRVALVWNLRVADGGFTDAYGRIVVEASNRIDPTALAGRAALAAPLLASTRFSNARVIEVPSPQSLDEAGVMGRALSASYFPRQEPERSERLSMLRESFHRFAVDGRVVIHHVAQMTLAEKRKRGPVAGRVDEA